MQYSIDDGTTENWEDWAGTRSSDFEKADNMAKTINAHLRL